MNGETLVSRYKCISIKNTEKGIISILMMRLFNDSVAIMLVVHDCIIRSKNGLSH